MSGITYSGTAKNFSSDCIDSTSESTSNLSSPMRRVASSYFRKAHILYVGGNCHLKLEGSKAYASYTYLPYLLDPVLRLEAAVQDPGARGPGTYKLSPDVSRIQDLATNKFLYNTSTLTFLHCLPSLYYPWSSRFLQHHTN